MTDWECTGIDSRLREKASGGEKGKRRLAVSVKKKSVRKRVLHDDEDVDLE